ncbi:phosphate transport system permease protein PstC [Clostridium acetireducens DSM 10703]|jgi:phosphate transport system permease protein|uniref:Phosphate transport system permease protein n=1 Tax=Clostridium acetireducens DSM 10703 TaxID=1121290 RepID=A0A1E8EXE5_9CLOT|nr:phosphate ABC transporter permease subunit PstC [Clostridium acetireducens]OFI05446.1 phosphate transport system permease protein PstC [Clostridium acetireducens DSM 10703]
MEKSYVFHSNIKGEPKKRSFIKKLKTEYIGKTLSTICGLLIVILTLSIIGFLTVKGVSTFTKHNYSVIEFIFSSKWLPDAEVPQFGALIFIVGSTLVSLGAIFISAPLGIALAIFMNFISPKFGNLVLKPALELFVGIPSVVYGWVGICVLIPFLKGSSNSVGFSLIAGIIVLSVMILPTISSISSDAMKTVPKDYLEASYGLGATRWQTITKVIIPSAKNGILTSVILGITRAFGEALAVQMVIGNTLQFPKNLYSPTSTLTGVLTMDMANTISGTLWNDALWSLALFLLIVSFIFILIIKFISAKEVK